MSHLKDIATIAGTIALYAAILSLFAGCATPTVCSRYPCEWSRPAMSRPKAPPVTHDAAVELYLCLKPTRQYPDVKEACL